MYKLTINNHEIFQANHLAEVWEFTINACGDITVAAFTEQGYKIEVYHVDE